MIRVAFDIGGTFTDFVLHDGRSGRTTFSTLAEHADVQRHTLYAHFPDERSLFMACSALHFEREPMPNANAWRRIANREERLRTGLRAL